MQTDFNPSPPIPPPSLVALTIQARGTRIRKLPASSHAMHHHQLERKNMQGNHCPGINITKKPKG
jgi:hypothetical protein